MTSISTQKDSCEHETYQCRFSLPIFLCKTTTWVSKTTIIGHDHSKLGSALHGNNYQSLKYSITLVLIHMSSAFPGWGTPGIPGGIATFYIKVTRFSEPSGMIWKQSFHPGEIRKAMRQWETMAATNWRLKMSPILGQAKGPEDQKDPGTGAHSSSILADSPR